MPLSVAQRPEPPSAGPPRASESEEPERLPGWSMRAKSSNTNLCQRHLMQAEQQRMCLQRRPIVLCHPYPPHRGWHNVRCKQSGRRRPNLVHLAGLPHCQHADPSSGTKLTSPNQTQNPALQNEAVWLTQLRLSRNMNIEKMNARTPPRPQGNVEGASTFTDATLLMGRGASAPSRQDVPLPWRKSLCHSLNPLPHPFDLIQTLPLPAFELRTKRTSSRQRNRRLLKPYRPYHARSS